MNQSHISNSATQDRGRGLSFFCDRILAGLGIMALAPLMGGIAVLVKLTSKGPVFYWSERIGIENKRFLMPKFRTMKIGTPALATHLLEAPETRMTPVGSFLRRMSLDELPQLFTILKGDLAVIGPRPALFNQDDLISLRTQMGIHTIRPGLTGWAQVNGRDDLPISQKVKFEKYYMEHRCLRLDLKIILMTIFKVLSADGVRH